MANKTDTELRIDQLIKALELGHYNAKPGVLRQGCISYISDHELTEEEKDDLWISCFGHNGRGGK